MTQPRLALVRHTVEEWCAVQAGVLRDLGCSDEYIVRYLDSLRARARQGVVVDTEEES